MTPAPSLIVERIDDLPLLLAQWERLGLRDLLDQHFPTHGHWRGLSLGWTATLWLTHLLSEGDHRLNQVEPWALAHLTTLRQCTGQPVERLDLTDDRLAGVLRALADDDRWAACETGLTERLLRVYALDPAPVRLDMTTASSEQFVTADGLFQWGYSKDRRPDLPQVKIALATLDPLGLPLATLVVPGNQGDDPLYRPLINRARAVLGRGARLYVGDAKMALPETRAAVHAAGDYYLCPLPLTQLPNALLDAYLAPVWEGTQPLTVLQAGATPEEEPAVEGFEIAVPLQVLVDGETVGWTERRLLARSAARANSEAPALRQRVASAQAALAALNVPGPGKPYTLHRERMEAAVRAILERQGVAEWIQVATEEVVRVRRVRRSQGRRARRVTERRWQVQVTVDQASLEAALRRLGWRAYATDAPAAQLALAAVVPAYRGQWVIERGFERLKGRPLSLTPIYLQKERHILGLIRLLALALRVLCLIEFAVRRNLAKRDESLAGLYAGQPRRATAQPTSEALLRAFRGVSLVLLPGGPGPPRHVTALSPLQERILALLDLPADIYSRLSSPNGHFPSI
jgi:transposase